MDSLSGVGKNGGGGKGGKPLQAVEWLLVGLGNRPYEEAMRHDLALTFLRNEQQRRASRKGLAQRAEGSASIPSLGFSVAPGLGGSCLSQRLSLAGQEPCPGGWEG